MAYQFIEHLPSNAEELASVELRALTTVWNDKKNSLIETNLYQNFIANLNKEWAIETGLIERLYHWDRGVTEVLIEQGIDSAIIAHQGRVQRDTAEQIKSLIDDQLGIVEGLFSYVKREQPLTEHFIRNLHAKFTTHQDTAAGFSIDGKRVHIPLEKGVYKVRPNNPRRPDGVLHHYCPPEQTKNEMENLLKWYREIEYQCAPEVLAAWLHHRFVQIHPFQDGNGRVARALASLVFLQNNIFPLVIRNLERDQYIDALEKADFGDLTDLVDLFVERQRSSILNALSLEQKVRQKYFSENVWPSVAAYVNNDNESASEKTKIVQNYSSKIVTIINKEIKNFEMYLERRLSVLQTTDPSICKMNISSSNSNTSDKYSLYNQIVEVANSFDYSVEFLDFEDWMKLSITNKEYFAYILSLHWFGDQESGIMVVSALTVAGTSNNSGNVVPLNVQSATRDLFQFNYAESIDSIEFRFNTWLSESVEIAESTAAAWLTRALR